MSFHDRVIHAIKQIPKGKVATYGQVAALAGSPRAAIIVGQILRHNTQDLPWQRVINSQGRISIININFPAQVQASLLEQEGVKVRKMGKEFFVNLETYLWRPN